MDVPSPAGTIASSRVSWALELLTVSADQALIPAEDEDEDGNSIEDAKEFLLELLEELREVMP